MGFTEGPGVEGRDPLDEEKKVREKREGKRESRCGGFGVWSQKMTPAAIAAPDGGGLV